MILTDEPPIWETLTGDPVEMEDTTETGFRVGAQHRLFHAELRRWRLAHGLTQKQLSKLAGLPEQKVNALENFRVFPTEQEQERLAEVTDIPADHLFPPWLKEWATEAKVVVTEHDVSPSMLGSREMLALTAPGDAIADAEREADRELLADHLDAVLATLKPREQRVMRLRFGLDGGNSRDLSDVGRQFGISRERVRQIESEALRKLRHPSRARPLKPFLDTWPGLSRKKATERGAFLEWLADQSSRDDDIGKLAAFVLAKDCCTLWATGALKDHLIERHGADDRVVALFAAAVSEFKGWLKQRPPATPEPTAGTVDIAPKPPGRRLRFTGRKPSKPAAKMVPPTPKVADPVPAAPIPPPPSFPMKRTEAEARAARLTPAQLEWWEGLNASRRRLGLPEVWG